MRLLAAILSLTLANAAAVHAAPEDLSCRNGDFPTGQQSFGLAKVSGTGRLNFLGDMDGCPSEEARCRQRAYVVEGDVLLTGRSHGRYVCVFFANRGGGDAGWAPRERLAPMPVPSSPLLSAWVGRWSDGDDTITLKTDGGALVAEGEAYWPSAHPSRSAAPGGPNVGDLSGTARPSGDRVVFSDGDPQGCTATLTLVEALLVVRDNDGCGGMNVSFTGVYRRGS